MIVVVAVVVVMVVVVGAVGARDEARVQRHNAEQTRAEYDGEKGERQALVDERARPKRHHDRYEPEQSGRRDYPRRAHGEHGAQRLHDVAQYVVELKEEQRVAVARRQMIERDDYHRVCLWCQNVAHLFVWCTINDTI